MLKTFEILNLYELFPLMTHISTECLNNEPAGLITTEQWMTLIFAINSLGHISAQICCLGYHCPTEQTNKINGS